MGLLFRLLMRLSAGLALVFGGVVPAAGPAAAQQTIPVGEPAAAEWMTYGGNLFNHRYSSLNQITTDNVAQLKGAWTFHTNAFSAATSFESSPIVVGGIMYLTGPQSQVWALDARTGQQLWAYIPDMSDVADLPLCCGQVNRGVAVGQGKVFVAQLNARLVALDAQSGQVIWNTQVDDPQLGFSETMAPVYFDGLVYIGVSGAEYEIRGHVTAYDGGNGQQVWRWFTIPAPGEPGSETWPADSDAYKAGGGSVWQAPAIDPRLGLLYVTVGNPSPDLDGTQRPGDNLYTESMVALDLKSGQRRWHFQQIHHDIWDYDSVSPNVLFDVNLNGSAVLGIGEAGKTGWVYLLDRVTGQPLLGIDETAVPQDATQHTSPTQPFPVGDAFVPQVCPEQIGNFPSGSIFSPVLPTPVLICPGANGGSEWSPASYNPRTNLMYVCGIHQPQIWTTKPEEIAPGTLRLGSAFVTPPGGRTAGTFTAIDVRTNKVAWQANWDQMCIGGSMTTAGGLVFTGDGTGNALAYDARTGQRLWQFQTGAGVNAPPITYQIGDTQYVTVAAGGNFQLNFPRGDTLWTFALNGTMEPTAAPPAPSPVVTATPVSTDTAIVEDFDFKPDLISIPLGTSITWTNNGPTVHTVTSNDQVFDSGLMQVGDTFSFTFDTPGMFPYFCEVHPFMQAQVIVDSEAQPGDETAPNGESPPPDEEAPAPDA
jgi:alcohol dehydrogenase (cytochrome c)